MQKKQIAITLSVIAILNLSAPPKAFALDLGGLAGGIIGSLSDLGYISEGLAKNLSFYTKLGESLLKFIDTKSLSALTSILPDILGKFGSSGNLAQCSENGGGDCSEDQDLVGEGGVIDWEKVATAVDEGVKAATAAADKSGIEANNSGQISSGVTDIRFRPRITAQINATQTATWAQLQDAQFQALTGKEGQQFIKEERESIAKLVQEHAKNTGEIAKLDNTQDILKKGSINDTLSVALQQRSLEEQLQTRMATYEGNNTKTKQLSIQQKQEWRDEVERAYEQQSADIQGQTYADFISSAYTDPGQTSPQ
jgi:hypothetical protein